MRVNRKSAVAWALKHKKREDLLFASGCCLAPWLFPSREKARGIAAGHREHGLDVTPVRVSVTVTVKELN